MSELRNPTSRDLRRANRAAVFRAVHRLGPAASRSDVVELTGLSAATVSVVVGELTERGVLVRDTAGSGRASGAGRPRERLRFDRDFGQLVGIDVAETYVHARAFDLSLTPTASWSSDRGPDSVDELVEMCRAAVADLRGSDLLGVGVSLPGLVDVAEGRLVRSPDGRVRDVAVAAPLAAGLALPTVHVDNPLRASVLAELWAGAGRSEPDLAVLTFGTGVGAGLSVDGVLRRGVTDLAGEWGHLPLLDPARTCRCGRTGCLEAYLGAPGILTTLAERGASVTETQTDAIAAFAADIDAGDPAARGALADIAEQLAVGLVVLRMLLDPARVVAAGWVADALGDRLLEPALDRAAPRMLRPLPDGWLQRSELGDGQVTLGAAALALDDAVDRLV
ncbi:MAG TPA: ROK family protein [Jatrophihabitans sp.]|jgi:predicted NBD/HSP70 family sugar kinase